VDVLTYIYFDENDLLFFFPRFAIFEALEQSQIQLFVDKCCRTSILSCSIPALMNFPQVFQVIIDSFDMLCPPEWKV
jgi:hypothetical protein